MVVQYGTINILNYERTEVTTFISYAILCSIFFSVNTLSDRNKSLVSGHKYWTNDIFCRQ